ncbi:MAG TPA: Stf0 family sulfotransferase [Microlunatus sp.]
MTPRLSYLICGTPRTGSTYLCGLLASTGVTGRPESYFRVEGELEFAQRWGVDLSGGDVDRRQFLAAAVAAGSTPNGVFAARVMWGSLENVVSKIDPDLPAHPRDDLDRLRRAFGPELRFVQLRRQDRLGQAVSWARAEQTAYWQQGNVAQAEPRFDADQIDELLQTIEEHNAAWRQWFAAAGVQPLMISYEDLIADPDGTIRGLLDQLGIDAGPGIVITAPDRRQADAVNAEWVQRYRALGRPTGRRNDCPGRGSRR